MEHGAYFNFKIISFSKLPFPFSTCLHFLGEGRLNLIKPYSESNNASFERPNMKLIELEMNVPEFWLRNGIGKIFL